MELRFGLKKALKQIKDKGIYLLEIFADKKIKIDHKKFSYFEFDIGYYYYVGSAQKNILKRIERHKRKTKNKHWHIDYLTTHNNAVIVNIYVIPDADKDHECRLVHKLLNDKKLSIPIKGFGNSDCSNCESHLLYAKSQLDYNHLLSLYHSTVLFIPSSKDIS